MEMELDPDAELLIPLAGLLVVYSYIILRRRQRERRRRRWWVRPILRNRNAYGDEHHLVQELKNDSQYFFKYMRMNIGRFEKLLAMLEPRLRRNHWRALSPELKLVITLRYLSTGDEILSLALEFRIGLSTAYKIIKEVCIASKDALKEEYLKPPSKHEYRNIATEFESQWNFPNCLGAVDGKHVQIQCPPRAGSLYFNYKKTHSIVLLAVCDASYRFRLVDVGAYGGENDAAVFRACNFGRALYEGTLDIPTELKPLPGTNDDIPYVFVGDEAFGLSDHMMRPYSGRMLEERKKIFNYRLSRARRTIENAFGILASKWRVYRKPICKRPGFVDAIIWATVCLHNYLRSEDYTNPTRGQQYLTSASLEEPCNMERAEIRNLMLRGQNYGGENREKLTNFFLSPAGQVPWQLDYIRRGQNRDHPEDD